VVARPRLRAKTSRAEGIDGVPDSFPAEVLKWLPPLIVTGITKAAEYFLTARPKIVYFATDVVVTYIGDRLVQTQTLAIQNIGRQLAEDVTVCHNWVPDQVSVWPPGRHDGEALLGRNHALVLNIMRPGETVIITYIYGTPPTPMPVFSSVSIKDHVASQVRIPLARRYPGWITASAKILVLVGIFFVSLYVFKGLALSWQEIKNYIPE
jgi:hypothetical protein